MRYLRKRRSCGKSVCVHEREGAHAGGGQKAGDRNRVLSSISAAAEVPLIKNKRIKAT